VKERTLTNGCVTVLGIVKERLASKSRVEAAIYVVLERLITEGRVGQAKRTRAATASYVTEQRLITNGRVLEAECVAIERLIANCRIVGAEIRVIRLTDVVKERLGANGRVEMAECIAIERFKTIGGVSVGVVVKERLITSGRVVATGDIVKERVKAKRCVVNRCWGGPLPLRVRLPKAPSPSAVVPWG
jgi:hypothetical protein